MAAGGTPPFQEFMEKGRESYVRAFTRAQELLARVYRGELEPQALQVRLAPFLQDLGPEFSRQLGGLSFELFRGLSEVQARYAEDFMRGLLGDGVAPAPSSPPPASADVKDWAQWNQALAGYALEQTKRAQSRYQQLLEKVANGEITPATIQEYSARFATDSGALLSRDSAELNTRFFEGLLRLNQQFTESLFDQLNNGSGQPDDPMESLYLDFVGSPGATVSASLIVENTRAESADVCCRISEFRDADRKGSPFRAPLEVTPTDFRLRPGETRDVSLRLVLEPEVFVPGWNYSGTLLINKNGQGIVVALAARATGDQHDGQTSSVVNLSGPIGGVAATTLKIANTKQERASIRCTATDVRRADGIGPAFAPKIISTREVFDVGPGEEASLQLSLQLDEAAYETDALYTGAVLITGLGKSRIEVPLRIIASQAAPVSEHSIKISPQ